jgi:hypothetical protein
MTARESLRGHPIHWDEQGGCWRYTDNGAPTAETWQERPCGHCGRQVTPEGHDPCLGTLPGVRNACCGHGVRDRAYIQFHNGVVVRGFDVIETEDTSAWCGEGD